MSIEVNSVLKGKVTGIQSFGAFVALEGEDTQGLIHISEVSNTYVKDINDFLTVGQEVEVKVIKVDTEKNKISLSIRALMPDPEGRGKRESKGESRENTNGNAPRAPKRNAGGGRRRGVASPKIENTEEGYNVLGEKLREALKLDD